MNLWLFALIVALVAVIVILAYLLSCSNAQVKETSKELKDLQLNLSYARTLSSSRSKDTMIAEDRAKRNQERFIRFRSDMVKLYAMHEYCATKSVDLIECIASWDKLSVGEQALWLSKGQDFVERNYGYHIG